MKRQSLRSGNYSVWFIHMKKAMTTISLHLPAPLARDSKKIANALHVSRAEFMRMAIEKAIEEWKKKQEIAGMAKAFAAMKNDPEYMKEAEEIMDGFYEPLPDEEDEWWTKK